MQALLVQNLTYVGVALLGVAGLLAMLHLIEAAVGRYVAHHWGWNGVLVTAWIGVPVHELSHLFFAWVFGHRIVGWKLFDPDPATGTLGYVRHAYKKRTVWQLSGDFFIGVAPVVGGVLALTALLAWMVTPQELLKLWQRACQMHGDLTSSWSLAQSCAQAIWQHRSAWLPLQLYACAAVACHMAPSKQDFASAWLGTTMVVGLAIAAALAATLIEVPVSSALLVLAPLAACVVIAAVLQTAMVGVVFLTSR